MGRCQDACEGVGTCADGKVGSRTGRWHTWKVASKQVACSKGGMQGGRHIGRVAHREGSAGRAARGDGRGQHGGGGGIRSGRHVCTM